MKEYDIKLNEKIKETEELELGCSISFKIVKKEENEEGKIGQVSMEYMIDLLQIHH